MENVLALQQMPDGIGPEDEGEGTSSTSPFCSTHSNNCVDGLPSYQVI